MNQQQLEQLKYKNLMRFGRVATTPAEDKDFLRTPINSYKKLLSRVGGCCWWAREALRRQVEGRPLSLLGAFPWGSSPEGLRFWRELANEICRSESDADR